jgi:molybdopterin synthase sulfur carrier subunit
MPRVAFTPNLARHVSCPMTHADGATVREVLRAVFSENARLGGYVLDDQGGVRRHMSVFVDGRQIKDRAGLSDPVGPDSEIFVAQALSGG